MIDELFKYYKVNLTFRGTVFKKIDWYYKLLCFMFIALFLVFWGRLFLYKGVWNAILSFVMIALFVFIARIAQAKSIKKNYREHWKSFVNWSHKGLKETYLNNLDSKIKQYNESKLDMIQELISQKSKDAKRTQLIFISAFIVLFGPLWASFIDSYVEIVSQTDIESLLSNYGLLLFLAVLFSIAVILTEGVLNIFSLHLRWSEFNELIKECRIISLDEDKAIAKKGVK